MINLLPPDMKEDLLYARRNSQLLRWVSALALVIVGVFVLVIFGQLYIEKTSKSYAAQIEESREQLKIQKLEETQKRVENISSSVKLAVQVLSRQVLFSSLLRQIGSAMPEGAVLTGLSIEKIEGGINLTARATDYKTASQVQVNLQDSNNKIFEKADILSIQCGTEGGTDQSTPEISGQYPCTVTVRALFAKDNPFMLIKKSGGNQ